MRQYLLPVWGYSRFVSAARDFGLPQDEDGAITGWWDQPPFSYSHLLISYVHWKKPFKFPEGAYVFGDSGGFSLRSETRAHTIDPLDVLTWQAGLCTVGCVLDLPPRAKQRIWHHGMKVTVEHTKRALPEYKRIRATGSKFRWWGVLHGNNEAEVREYHENLAAVYPFTDDGEGWAIRAEPNVNIYSVARSLRILRHLGIKKAHFLAATSQDVIAVLLALGPQAGLEVLTYDSAYATKSGFNRHIFRPREDGITFAIMTEEGEDRTGRDWLMHQCPCDVCAYMRIRSQQVDDPRIAKAQPQLLAPEFGGWWSTWLQFHDLHIQQKLTAAQAVEAEKHPDSFLRMMLSAKEYTQVMRIYEEDGHEPKMSVPTGTSKSLLDYL